MSSLHSHAFVSAGSLPLAHNATHSPSIIVMSVEGSCTRDPLLAIGEALRQHMY